MKNKFFLFLETLSSYHNLDKIYCVLRFLICPFFKMESLLPKKGKIVDIGCGEGVFAQFIARCEKRRKVVGIDIDDEKIIKARKASVKVKNLSFVKQDALSYSYNSVSAVILSDFLHHLSFKKQKLLLKKIIKELDSDGISLIKEINSQDLIRSRLSRIWDFLFYPKDKIYYNDLAVLKNFFRKKGLNVRMTKEMFLFPGSTNLLIFYTHGILIYKKST